LIRIAAFDYQYQEFAESMPKQPEMRIDRDNEWLHIYEGVFKGLFLFSGRMPFLFLGIKGCAGHIPGFFLSLLFSLLKDLSGNGFLNEISSSR